MVIVCFVCVPVASNTQTDLPCEPWFGSGGGAEIFVHLEKEAFTDFHSFNTECLLMFALFACTQWQGLLRCFNTVKREKLRGFQRQRKRKILLLLSQLFLEF